MKNLNHNVQCTVAQCSHHDGSEDYCTLNCVHIGTHELNPTMEECVDCQSFQVK